MLGFYKLNPNIKIPEYATELSACFDLRAWLANDTFVKSYSMKNDELPLMVQSPSSFAASFLSHNWRQKHLHLIIQPGHRVMVPTGLILDIPEGYSVRIHPRSSLSLKQGLVLANAEGVIDADYIDPLYILIMNVSGLPAHIAHDERIAQGELVQLPSREFRIHGEASIAPQQKTSRVGGFGSTGTA